MHRVASNGGQVLAQKRQHRNYAFARTEKDATLEAVEDARNERPERLVGLVAVLLQVIRGADGAPEGDDERADLRSQPPLNGRPSRPSRPSRGRGLRRCGIDLVSRAGLARGSFEALVGQFALCSHKLVYGDEHVLDAIEAGALVARGAAQEQEEAGRQAAVVGQLSCSSCWTELGRGRGASADAGRDR